MQKNKIYIIASVIALAICLIALTIIGFEAVKEDKYEHEIIEYLGAEQDHVYSIRKATTNVEYADVAYFVDYISPSGRYTLYLVWLENGEWYKDTLVW